MPTRTGYGAPQRPHRPQHKPRPEQPNPSQLTALTPQNQPGRPLLRGNQDLPTMTNASEPGGPIYNRTVIIPHAQIGYSGMRRHANAKWERRFPELRMQAPLYRNGCGDGFVRLLEDGKEAVPLSSGPYEHSPMLLNTGIYKIVVTHQCLAHRIWVLVPQPGTAYDIGKEEGYRSRRQIYHGGIVVRSTWLNRWRLRRCSRESPSTVLLPNPAGAEARVSLRSVPWTRRSISLARVTRPVRHLGM